MLPGEVLEQSDGTAWIAKFCLNMLEMALLLANRNPVYEDVAIKFFEHFALIAAMHDLWDEQDGFFYDRLRTNDGSSITVRAGLLPVFAAVELERDRLPLNRGIPKGRRVRFKLRAGRRPAGMARAYSLDLRERVVAAAASGQSCRSVAKTFMASVASVVK
jgi:hypothetical protein